jgi:3-oxoacyl-[acyl-carrier protein] reductase
VITGGAGAIGQAIAERFLSRGGTVVLADVDAAAAARAAQAHTAAGAIVGMGVDVTDPTSSRELTTAVVDRFGRLDFLVNNAGLNRGGSSRDQTKPDWDAILDVNLTGAFNMAQAAIPAMELQRGGRIVNVASRVWLGGGWLGGGGNAGPGYIASKAGLIGLTRALALELGVFNITANAVAPSPIKTPFTLAQMTQGIVTQEESQTPLRRLGTPEDVAGVVAFLCSADASFVTGEVIHVCGGSQLV